MHMKRGRKTVDKATSFERFATLKTANRIGNCKNIVRFGFKICPRLKKNLQFNMRESFNAHNPAPRLFKLRQIYSAIM